MSVITFQRKHGKSESDSRAAAENMALQLKKEFGLEYVWDGEVMQFSVPAYRVNSHSTSKMSS